MCVVNVASLNKVLNLNELEMPFDLELIDFIRKY
jgi:hypothetical protein